MSDEISVDSLDTFRQFHIWMQTVDDDYTAVDSYVSLEVCNTSGFTGVLTPLQDAMTLVAGYYSDLTTLANSKWADAAAALYATGRLYDQQDGVVQGYFSGAERPEVPPPSTSEPRRGGPQ